MAEAKERKLPGAGRQPGDAGLLGRRRQGQAAGQASARACGQLHHYPRTICPFCFSDKTDWIEASGKGTIYSYT